MNRSRQKTALILGLFFQLLLLPPGHAQDNTPAFGQVRPGGLVHILDIELRNNHAYVGGFGGFWIIDINDVNSPSIIGETNFGGPLNTTQIYGIAYSGDIVYGFTRNNGMKLINVSNPSAPQIFGTYKLNNNDSYEHGVVNGNYLYIAAHEKGLQVVDISNAANPVHVTSVQTTNAFFLDISGNWLFVADGVAGLTVLDISNPGSPTVVATHTTSALAQDVVVSGNSAYVAVGSSGLDIFDVSNPAAPVFQTNYYTSGFTNRVDVKNDHAYLANWQSVEIVDVSSVATPQLVATQHAIQRSMCVQARDDDMFFVGDWADFRIFRHDNFPAPDINIDPLELTFGTVQPGETQVLPFTIENQGQQSLNVSALQAVGNDFSVQSSSFALGPFETRTIDVTYAPQAISQTSGFINVVSDDPDESQKILPVSGGNRIVGVGDIPTDFTLLDTAGVSYRLQDFINQEKIIVLALYASW